MFLLPNQPKPSESHCIPAKAQEITHEKSQRKSSFQKKKKKLLELKYKKTDPRYSL